MNAEEKIKSLSPTTLTISLELLVILLFFAASIFLFISPFGGQLVRMCRGLPDYRFRSALGMSAHELTYLLKRTPGHWTIFRERILGSSEYSYGDCYSISQSYGFLITDGKVSAVNRIETTVSDTTVYPWVDCNGYEPRPSPPFLWYHNSKVLDEFIVCSDKKQKTPDNIKRYDYYPPDEILMTPAAARH